VVGDFPETLRVARSGAGKSAREQTDFTEPFLDLGFSSADFLASHGQPCGLVVLNPSRSTASGSVSD
jgi:hypothetical protein